MTFGQNDIRALFMELRKKFGGSATLDEVIKRTANCDINFKKETPQLDLLQANLLSAFWIKNVDITINPEVLLGSFDPQAIVGIYRVNTGIFELIDLENKKIRVSREDLSVKVKKVPLDVFLSFVA